MDALWAKMHGASTHFPFALVLSSGVLDAAGFILGRRPIARDLSTAGCWAMLLGALGTVPAVFSGLLMTKGSVLGHGAVRWHHLFVWPAFASIVGLALWRLLAGPRATRRVFAGYLLGVGVAAVLVSAASYWGGEMVIGR